MRSSSLLWLGLVPLVRGSGLQVENDQTHVAPGRKDESTLNLLILEEASEAVLSDAMNETSIQDFGSLTEEEYYGVDLGTPQTLYDDYEDQQVARIAAARDYMRREVWVSGGTQVNCINHAEECSYYAVAGECERNPTYMEHYCAPVCNACAKHIAYQTMSVPTPPADENCPVDLTTNALQPGDLHKMFERIVADPDFQVYEPRVISRPTLADGDSMETAEYHVGGPWMIVFDNIVTKEEAERLVQLGALEGYERSLDVQNYLADGSIAPGVSEARTSTNSWCNGDCARDPLALGVIERMAKITGIPESYAEDLQLLRYTEGQFYKVHHDYIPSQTHQPVGARILTFYIYLNDVPESNGGGTNFPYVDPSNPDLTITPKRGRAVLWPSVLNDYPDMQDDRTLHQALPVLKGVKYGANAWIHMRDFKNNNMKGCT